MAYKKGVGFICTDSRPCGGRKKSDPGKGRCMCLETGYPDGKCPFCKPDFTVTKGKVYPHRDSLKGEKYQKIKLCS